MCANKEGNMRKSYRMEELECANCAAKMQAAIARLPGVQQVNISFMAQKMTIETVDERHEEIMAEADRICRSFEPDCRILR